MRTTLPAACVLTVLACAVPAMAQTVVNPRTVEFVPSADHAALSIDGTPMVERYELRMYLETDPATPLIVTDIGKPSPVAGLITVTNPVWFAGLTPRTKYVARVVAIGTSGEGVSDPGNPFGLVGPPVKPTNAVVKK